MQERALRFFAVFGLPRLFPSPETARQVFRVERWSRGRPRGPGPVSPRAAPFAHAEIDGVRNYLVVAEVDRDETACGADEKVQIDVKANLQWQGELAAVDFVEVPVPRAHSHGTRPRLPRPHLVRGVDVLANDPTTAEPFLRRRASAVCPS